MKITVTDYVNILASREARLQRLIWGWRVEQAKHGGIPTIFDEDIEDATHAVEQAKIALKVAKLEEITGWGAIPQESELADGTTIHEENEG